MAKLLLLSLLFSFSFAANAQAKWKHLLGLSYAVDSKITFPDATADIGLGSEVEMDIEYELEPAAGFIYEGRRSARNSWGVGLGLEHVMKRKAKRFKVKVKDGDEESSQKVDDDNPFSSTSGFVNF